MKTWENRGERGDRATKNKNDTPGNSKMAICKNTPNFSKQLPRPPTSKGGERWPKTQRSYISDLARMARADNRATRRGALPYADSSAPMCNFMCALSHNGNFSDPNSKWRVRPEPKIARGELKQKWGCWGERKAEHCTNR